MKPYYEDALVTLYHGNSLDYLSQLPPISLMVTDPPYGNDTEYDEHDDSKENLQDLIEYVVKPAIDQADRALITCGAANIAAYPPPPPSLDARLDYASRSGKWAVGLLLLAADSGLRYRPLSLRGIGAQTGYLADHGVRRIQRASVPEAHWCLAQDHRPRFSEHR